MFGVNGWGDMEDGSALKLLLRGCGWGGPRGSAEAHLAYVSIFVNTEGVEVGHFYRGLFPSGSMAVGTLKVCCRSLQPLFNA